MNDSKGDGVRGRSQKFLQLALHDLSTAPKIANIIFIRGQNTN